MDSTDIGKALKPPAARYKLRTGRSGLRAPTMLFIPGYHTLED